MFVFERAQGSYIAAVCRPDAAFAFSATLLKKHPTAADVRHLNASALYLKENIQCGLRFVKLDMSSLKLGVFVTSGFASSPDLSLQIGSFVVFMDDSFEMNIVHN